MADTHVASWDQKAQEACSTGDISTLQALLPKAAPESHRTLDDQERLLLAAVQNKHLPILAYLLSLAPSISDIPSDVVSAAICSASIPVYSLLLQHQPSILHYGWERQGDSVILGVLNNDLAFLAFLLEKGADPGRDPTRYDWRHHTGSVPLELAVLRSQKEIVQLLLRHGTSVHRTQAVQWAAEFGNLEILELLLESGADVDAILDEELRLYYACETFGTALHGAVEHQQPETVRFLLNHGADAALLDSEGKSPLARACELGNAEIIAQLREHGGLNEGC